jgi:hypothetical protein
MVWKAATQRLNHDLADPGACTNAPQAHGRNYLSDERNEK